MRSQSGLSEGAVPLGSDGNFQKLFICSRLSPQALFKPSTPVPAIPPGALGAWLCDTVL